MKTQRVVIAGARGFVGGALREALHSFEWIGLSRAPGGAGWRQANLWFQEEADRALEGATYAIYLVHSMLPSSKGVLHQGGFEDYDALSADCFGAACKRAGVKQIVYLGGLQPAGFEDDAAELSPHLRSRLEVEHLLGRHGVPLTTIRAGLIVGPEGSSFQILYRLVQRLPWMICPGWTQTRTQPVALQNVVESILEVLGQPEYFWKTYDIGCEQATTYVELMRELASVLGIRRKFLRIGLFSPKLSSLWVRLVTGAPKNLVSPLVESLSHEMIVHEERRLVIPGKKVLSVREMLETSLPKRGAKRTTPTAFSAVGLEKKEVYSIQRLSISSQLSERELLLRYFEFLKKISLGILEVECSGELVRFKFFGLNLMSFRVQAQTDDPMQIEGGLLVKPVPQARFGFRNLKGSETLVFVLGFRPRLPWLIYRFTQALLHLVIMKVFVWRMKNENPQHPSSS